MSGYDKRVTPFEGVHDSIYATAFYFTDQIRNNLIITADLLWFSFGFTDEVKTLILSATGILPRNIMLVAVHNHGGPSIDDVGVESVKEYVEVLKKKLVSLAIEATKNPEPFRMGTGKGSCKLNINRRAWFSDDEVWLGRNPQGPCDHELDLVKFESMDHKSLAVLVNWPCHGTASGEANYLITGDWPGSAARYIQKHTNENMLVGFTVGASADINPIYGPGNDFREVDAVGFHVGREATRVFGIIETHPVYTLQSTDTTLVFPGKKTSPDNFPSAVYEPGEDKEIRLSVIRIGNLAFAGISGELMTEIGLEVKKRSPYPDTIILTHCNGSSGYICTDQSFHEGGYEVQVTNLMPGVEKPITNDFVKLIQSVE